MLAGPNDDQREIVDLAVECAAAGEMIDAPVPGELIPDLEALAAMNGRASTVEIERIRQLGCQLLT